MAYVQPNSIIQFFKGINLDNRYMHTIYFANEAAQNSWFTGKVYKSFQQQSYTRYAINQIKVKDDATNLMDCTYLRFKNDRSVDKWFYAFINAVEYINENTTLITYEIDVMQTWFIQAGTIRPCMVLREHVSNDSFGVNLEAEPVGSDVYDCDPAITTSTDGDLFADYMVVVNTSGEPNTGSAIDPQTNVFPMLNNDLVIGTKMFLLRSDYAQPIKDAISATMNGSWDEQQRKEDIIDMYMIPAKFASYNVAANTHNLSVTHAASWDGYTPKNKKLYGYPYSYLQGTTKDGSGAMYKWEYFYDLYPNDQYAVPFTCYGNPIGGGTICCYPTSYNGIADNLDAKMVINDFPKIPYSNDAYQAWVAAGGKTRLEVETKITEARGVTALVSATSNMIAQTVQGGVTAYEGLTGANPKQSFSHDVAQAARGANQIVQGATGLSNAIIDYTEAKNKLNYQWNDAHYQPNQVVGSATPNIAVATRKLGFYFYNVHVRVDEMKRIDDFFSCYGYTINKVKTPELHSRQYWNFVQTQGAMIAGNMPASSKDAIARIFDGGITFWHNGDNVGNYEISVSSGTINNPII